MRLVFAAAWSLFVLLPARAEPVDVRFDSAEIDLLPLAEVVQSLSPQATVELPSSGSTPPQSIELNAQGSGPVYRWAVFTLHNPDPVPRELVVTAPHQRFVGSNVLWPLPEGSRVVGLARTDGQPVPPMASRGADSFALTIPPGATVSYVLEVSATGLNRLSLWHRDAFHTVADRYSFFRGLVLGISILLGISFVCLFIVRPQSVFPAAALFGWSAIAFLVIEAGYLPTVLAKFPALLGAEQKLRAVTEGMMLAGLIAMLVSFLDLRRRMPLVGNALMAGGAAAVLLAVYGWFEPRFAIGIIRIAFAAVVATGLGLTGVLWWRGGARAQASLLGCLVLAMWTVAAALGALDLGDSALMRPLVSAGLVLVLVTIGFTLIQLAFGLGEGYGEAYEEAGRRALALAASDQAVWDWHVDAGRFHVGPEIESALGLEEGACCDDPAAWLALIHPSDRAGYSAAVEAAERRGRGSFSQEFRLARADGSYRWYVLRARSIPGAGDRASRVIGTLADITALRRSEDRLLADAVRDRLTGLPNRALFLDRLEQAMVRARTSADAGLYAIALDLDRFKSFNDGLGDEAGDYLLHTIGRRLSACVGSNGTLARLPGHQFGIIWHEHPLAYGVAELIGAMSAAVTEPMHLPAGEVVITASMGVAHVHPEYRTAEAVLKDAEIALYEAKRQGYGAVAYFRPDIHDERSQLLQLEQNLRHALERDEIEVLYQPIVRLADRQLAGFEALMRWRRGDALLEPDSFMSLAEETGIIRELGRHVLKEATSRLGIWQRAFRPQEPLFVAVNISSLQLLNGDLVEDVQRAMEREDLRPGTLKLELTESVVVENPELAYKLLMRLKKMGVAVACDDFGTGHSGLESVFRLPFDSIKIDRCFLEVESGDRNWIMIEAMLRLSRDLGLDVVAEGIETPEQMERLSSLGCDYGQGYLIGPPVPAQQVVEALGGLSYGARTSETGLAAFWTRLTRPTQVPAPRPAAIPERDNGADPGETAPGPAKDADARPVISLRSMMPPAGTPPAELPKVGTAPFAPRRPRWPDLKLPEVVAPQLKPREAGRPEAAGPPEPQPPEPQQPEHQLAGVEVPEPEDKSAGQQDAPAVEEIPISLPVPGLAAAAEENDSAAADPAATRARRERREKRKAAKTASTNGSQGEARRGANSRAGKTGRAKSGTAKSAAAKSTKVKPAKAKPSAVKTAASRTGSRRAPVRSARKNAPV